MTDDQVEVKDLIFPYRYPAIFTVVWSAIGLLCTLLGEWVAALISLYLVYWGLYEYREKYKELLESKQSEQDRGA